MAKIKCPNCGATNQDVTEKDECWQCGTVLGGAAVSKTADTATVESPAPTEGEQVQKTLRKRPEGPSPLDRFMVDKPRQNRAPLVIAILIILIILIVLFVMMYLRK